ncbi:MAG: hypothetical protein H0U70_05690 [Tatlockia sp.]|nr:hypothetical protein [Tatlockia sp.]
MAVESDLKPLYALVGIPLTIMAILAATGKFVILATTISAGGIAFMCAGIAMSAIGFYAGIQFLSKGELSNGSASTISSGIILGVLIGAMVGILVPGIGTLIGPLAGAGIGLVAALIPVALAFCYEYFKDPVQTQTGEEKETGFSEVANDKPKQRFYPTAQPKPDKNAYFDKVGSNSQRTDDKTIELQNVLSSSQ